MMIPVSTVDIDLTTLSLDHVSSITDRSSMFMARLLVTYTNGCSVSVIRGSGSYGFASGLYEVQINGSRLVDDYLNAMGIDVHDGIEGYCDETQVLRYLNEVGYL